MRVGTPVAVLLFVLLAGLAGPWSFAPPSSAQDAAAVEADPAGDPAEAAREARKAEKQRAKEQRIREYLLRKEERRARRDLKRQDLEQMRVAAAAEATANVVQSAAAAPVAGRSPAASPRARRAARGSKNGALLPRNLARVQQALRERPIGDDPTVRGYLDLIERAEASPHQLAAFGNFLGQNGMHREAIAYYSVALGLEREDPVLWTNVGTLHRQLGEYSVAASAYRRALALDPGSAFAHYNLGAVFDELGDYEDSVEEYKIALTLDPTLGDPAYNPQAANNERLLAVKLMLYKEQAGSLGLPLLDVPGGELDEDDREP